MKKGEKGRRKEMGFEDDKGDEREGGAFNKSDENPINPDCISTQSRISRI